LENLGTKAPGLNPSLELTFQDGFFLQDLQKNWRKITSVKIIPSQVLVLVIPMFKSAHAHGDGTVFYFDEMGNKYAAIGGSLAWRINNPGLVHSHCSRKLGSIGNLGRYAIFPDPKKGRKALSTWIRSKKYFNSSLKAVAKHYQPKNPEGYIQQLSSLCSISPETKTKI
jgi:hypothetical protein